MLGILTETRENVPETSQFHVSVNVIGCNYCGNTSLLVGKWCFQVISTVKKALFTILGGFPAIYMVTKTYSLDIFIAQNNTKAIFPSTFFILLAS